MWPPRYLLRTIEALSIPLALFGSWEPARELARPMEFSRTRVTSRPADSARDLAKTRFNKVFAIAVQARFPG